MTETYASTSVADDIVDIGDDRPSAVLDRAADRILLDDQARARVRVASVRQALRDDLASGRQWGRVRAEEARLAIEADPLRATLYALGAGVLIGLLLRR